MARHLPKACRHPDSPPAFLSSSSSHGFCVGCDCTPEETCTRDVSSARVDSGMVSPTQSGKRQEQNSNFLPIYILSQWGGVASCLCTSSLMHSPAPYHLLKVSLRSLHVRGLPLMVPQGCNSRGFATSFDISWLFFSLGMCPFWKAPEVNKSI